VSSHTSWDIVLTMTQCIVSWVSQAKSKKQRLCPQCRKAVTAEPSPAYMVGSFLGRMIVATDRISGSRHD